VSGSDEPPLEELAGRVERQRVAVGTKSERDALVLVLPDGRSLILRRRGAPTFDEDVQLAAHVGETVLVRGTPLETTLLVDDCETLP
jgi:hypothetical protein